MCNFVLCLASTQIHSGFGANLETFDRCHTTVIYYWAVTRLKASGLCCFRLFRP